MGLPRSIIKKYGVTKKAWQVYRGNKTPAKKETKARSSNMAKRKAKQTNKRKLGFNMGGLLPLSTDELMIDFVAGAIIPTISQKIAPYQQQYLGTFGKYSDEAALAIVGAVAHKYGGKIHPMLSKAGKEVFRVAVINAGAQMAGSFVAKATNTENGNYSQNSF